MKRRWKETLWVRGWSLRNVFLLWFISPSVLELSDRRCEIVVPLNWRTRRHDIRAMYLGALCMGADVAGGLIAFSIVGRSKQRVSFIFKDLHAHRNMRAAFKSGLSMSPKVRHAFMAAMRFRKRSLMRAERDSTSSACRRRVMS